MSDHLPYDLTEKLLLCETCAPKPLEPAGVKKVDEDEDEIAAYETVECPSCGSQYGVELKHDRDRVRLDTGLITARQADMKRREGARRNNR